MANLLKGVGLTTPLIHVRPSHGEKKMRCGSCHHFKFGVYVTPHKDGSTYVSQLICDHCLRVFHVLRVILADDGKAEEVEIDEQRKEQIAK